MGKTLQNHALSSGRRHGLIPWKETSSVLASPIHFCVLLSDSVLHLPAFYLLLTFLFPTGSEVHQGSSGMAGEFLMGVTVSQKEVIPAFQLLANSSWHLTLVPSYWLGRGWLQCGGGVESKDGGYVWVPFFVNAKPGELGRAVKFCVCRESLVLKMYVAFLKEKARKGLP